VAYAQNRRRVEEHNIVKQLQLNDGIRHSLRVEDADCVGAKCAARQKGKIFDTGGGNHFTKIHLACEITYQTELVVDIEQTMLNRAAKIRVHDERGVPGLGASKGQVSDGSGFAFT